MSRGNERKSYPQTLAVIKVLVSDKKFSEAMRRNAAQQSIPSIPIPLFFRLILSHFEVAEFFIVYHTISQYSR